MSDVPRDLFRMIEELKPLRGRTRVALQYDESAQTITMPIASLADLVCALRWREVSMRSRARAKRPRPKRTRRALRQQSPLRTAIKKLKAAGHERESDIAAILFRRPSWPTGRKPASFQAAYRQVRRALGKDKRSR